MPSPLCVLLLFTAAALADILVKPRIAASVNYDDYTLLCADGIPLLMEDHRPRPCQPRPWLPEHKCPSGFWCHEGDDEASYYCCPRSRKFPNRCHLPPSVGHGTQTMRRFYYDWTTDGCHQLHYTGLGGNENSFMTYEQCEDACRGAGEPQNLSGKVSKNKKLTKKPLTTTTPTAPPSPMMKSSVEIKNATRSTSISPGDGNPMEKSPPTAITTTPHALLPTTRNMTTSVEVDPSSPLDSSATTPIPRLVLTTVASYHPENPWRGTNPCKSPADAGVPGGIARKMWYFDESQTTCLPFVFLGIGGNANRFADSEHCTRACGNGKPVRTSCDLPPQIGNGTYRIPRYYFDKNTKQCELFFYSGDGGNENRFLKKPKCERLCLGRKKNKKYSTPAVMTTISTMSTRPATRIFQELHSAETSTPTPVTDTGLSLTSAEPLQYTTSVEEHYPTLISLPREFVPPFPQVTLLPQSPAGQQGPSQPTATQPTPTEELNFIFEHLMTSSEQPAAATPSPVMSQLQELDRYPNMVELPDSSGRGSGEAVHQPPFQPPGSALQQQQQLQELLAGAWQANTQHVPPPRQDVYAPVLMTQAPEPPRLPAQPTMPPMFYISNPSIPNSHAKSSVSAADKVISVYPGHFASRPSTPHPEWVKHGVEAFQQILENNNNSTESETLPGQPVFATPSPLGLQLQQLPSGVTSVTYSRPVIEEGPLSAYGSFPVSQGQKGPLEVEPKQTDNDTNLVSPCHTPLYGEVVIMCELLEDVTCPQRTFCQVGDGQSICCPVIADTPPCEQRVQAGVGSSTLLRWYYDRSYMKCQPFIFHGFQGNQNNFETPSACEAACASGSNVCDDGEPLPTVDGSASCAESSTSSCPTGSYCKTLGGAGFCCPEQVQRVAPIHQPVSDSLRPECLPAPDAGYGLESSHRWSFSVSISACVSFIYNGYGGNRNNFLSRSDCETACKPPPSPCDQPVASGHGTMFISRFFFSKDYGHCLHFVYSGEGGNANNFANVHDCLNACAAGNNGTQFSSLPMVSPVLPFPLPQHTPLCPHGDVATGGEGLPIRCDATTGYGCPTGYVCTTSASGEAYCCQAPESFCLQMRPPLSVCLSPSSPPVQRIEFTYDPLADRCVRFSYSFCSPELNLNHFASSSQCQRLCCNQGYDLVYKRRLLMLNDSPLEDSARH